MIIKYLMIFGRVFLNTFSTCTTNLECIVKIKQTSEILCSAKNHQNIWRASSSGGFTALLIMGGGGGG